MHINRNIMTLKKVFQNIKQHNLSIMFFIACLCFLSLIIFSFENKQLSLCNNECVNVKNRGLSFDHVKCFCK